MTILFFVLFLLSYALSIFILFRLQQQTQKMDEVSGVRSVFVSLVALGFFFFHLWLLSGFWNLTLIGAFVCVLVASIVIARVLWAVIGPEEEINYLDQVKYFGVDFGLQSGVVMLLILIVANLFLLAFPVAMGIAYFSGDYSPEERTQTIIRYAVLLNVITGLFTFSPLLFSLLSSKNTNEDVRSVAAIQRVGGTLVTAMWIAMALWAFNTESGSGFTVFAGQALEFKISPLLVAIVFGFMILTLFLPYLMGAQRGKKWRIRLLQARRNFVSQVIDLLSEPKFDPHDLSMMSFKIDAEIQRFHTRNRTLEIWREFDAKEPWAFADPQQAELADVFAKGRDTDLRFQHLDQLNEIKEDIGEMVEVLSKSRRKGDIDRYIRRYENMERKLSEQIKEQESFRPQIYAVVFFFVSAIISQVFSSFGQWAWAVFSGTPAAS